MNLKIFSDGLVTILNDIPTGKQVWVNGQRIELPSLRSVEPGWIITLIGVDSFVRKVSVGDPTDRIDGEHTTVFLERSITLIASEDLLTWYRV